MRNEQTLPPPLAGILETAIYSDDLDRADRFYSGLCGLKIMMRSPRLIAYNVSEGEVLLLFERSLAPRDTVTPKGLIPGHGSTGPSHFAFKIAACDLESWRAHLAAHIDCPIDEMRWPAGGISLYVKDPDGNIIEFACPPNWPNFQ